MKSFHSILSNVVIVCRITLSKIVNRYGTMFGKCPKQILTSPIIYDIAQRVVAVARRLVPLGLRAFRTRKRDHIWSH
jgi:hypothetical protein